MAQFFGASNVRFGSEADVGAGISNKPEHVLALNQYYSAMFYS
jgi:hypothetical protein